MNFNLPIMDSKEGLFEVDIGELDKFCLCVGLRQDSLYRIALGLKVQLYATYLNYKVFGNVDYIVREINGLELGRGSITKRENKFKKGVAKGFWKKHYFDGTLACYANNLYAECGENLEKLEPLIERKFAQESSGFITSELISKITKMIVDKAYLSRARRGGLTGQYIVFSKTNGIRNYVCLARHDENDENLASMIEAGVNSLKSLSLHYYNLPT